jgi:hypothetical protein
MEAGMSSRVEPAPGIREVARHVGGATIRLQTLACTVPGCTECLEVRIAGSHKPPDVVYNMAKRRGWTLNLKKVEIACPNHR